MNELIAKIIRPLLQELLLFPVVRFYSSSFEIEGLSNLESITGPVVFVANHSSHADTGIILLALPARIRRKLRIAAAADYFYKNKFLGSLVSTILNTFPFERHQPRRGMRKAKECLREGNSLLIYPEGHRALPDEELCFKRGFASLACQFGLPVVPIALEGSYEMLPKGAKYPRKSRVRIAFGKPIMPKGHNSIELAQLAEEQVCALRQAA